MHSFPRFLAGRSLPAIALLLAISPAIAGPRHYVFFGRDRERIGDRSFLDNKVLEGAQLRYSWRELEQGEDGYDFAAMEHDLAFLSSHGKRLFVQIQDISYSLPIVPLPKYLLTNPAYHGGVEKQYLLNGKDEDQATPTGWVARRWDPAVQGRLRKLFLALGKQFDGKIEGINLAETSIDFGETGRLYPKDFTPRVYRDATIANMSGLKQAFPKSVAMVYANFMPGGPSFLRDIYRSARELNVGMGGPDVKPYREFQMENSYPLLRDIAGAVPTGIAVQDGNYEIPNPRTGKAVTVAELLAFARDYLNVKYVFWCTQEPYYSRDVIPYLSRLREK